MYNQKPNPYQNFNTFLDVFSIVEWIKDYKFKDFIIKDIIAGLTVTVMQIAQGIAYGSILAAQLPQYGLISSLFPVIIYAIFGSSNHLSVGMFAVTCLMQGQSSENLHPINANMTVAEIDAVYQARISDASAVSFYVGLILVVMSIFRAGFLVGYLSAPMMSGFIFGSACHVFTSQLKTLMTLSIERYSGPAYLVKTYIALFKAVIALRKDTYLPVLISFGISLGLIAVLVIFRILNENYKNKYFRGIPLPGELIVMIIGLVIFLPSKLNESHEIPVIGKIPNGFPTPKLPNLSRTSNLITAIPIAIVGYSVHVATGKVLASQSAQKMKFSANKELTALGLGNAISSFLLCISAFSSMSRSMVQFGAGGITQMASIVSCFLLLLVILVAGPLFYYIPKLSQDGH